MRIVIVEDDHAQRRLLRERVQEWWPNARIEEIATESEFRERVRELCRDKPDLILMDVMLKWSEPIENVDPEMPDDVRAGRHYVAGIRCERMLRGDKSGENVAVILFTVLERADIDEHLKNVSGRTIYLGKAVDGEVLRVRMRELMR